MAFAETADVAARLGRDLTAVETTSLGFLLQASTEVICVHVEKDEDAVDPVPPVLKGVCVSMALRGLNNPNGLASRSETLGAYSQSETFNREIQADVALTTYEQMLVRRAVWGKTSGSSRMEATLLKEALDEYDA